MPSIHSLLGQQPQPQLCPACETYLMDAGRTQCRYCDIAHQNATETPEQRYARLWAAARERHAVEDAFAARFPGLVAVARTLPKPGYRSEAETYSEGIFDDD